MVTPSSQFHSYQLLRIIIQLLTEVANAAPLPITRPGCPDMCGDVLVPFPFGIGSGCFFEGFEVTCNNSFPPRAFITNRELNDPSTEWPYSGLFQDMLELVYPAGSSDPSSTKLPRGMPFVFDFAIRNGTCLAEGELPRADYACVSENSYCASATNGQGYVCKCSENYKGNPYIKNGCQDINECEQPAKYPCQGICKNKPGRYDCLCKAGMKGDGNKGNCAFPLVAKVVVGKHLN